MPAKQQATPFVSRNLPILCIFIFSSVVGAREEVLYHTLRLEKLQALRDEGQQHRHQPTMVTQMRRPGQHPKYKHHNFVERSEPAFPGANFDIEGYCVVHNSIRLSELKKDGNYRTIRKLCPKCGSTGMPAHNRPVTSRIHGYKKKEGSYGSGSNELSGSGSGSGSGNPPDPPAKNRTLEKRSSLERRKAILSTEVNNNTPTPTTQVVVYEKTNREFLDKRQPPQPIIEACPDCFHECPCCTSRVERMQRKNSNNEKQRLKEKQLRCRASGNALRINHDRMFTKHNYL
jgi:ribosomal protein S27AE